MVLETEFIRREELPVLDRNLVDQVAFPVEDRYPQEIFDNYFAWYYALILKFKPRRMLEIGVRYGYTAIYACHAALRAGCLFDYLGIDDESYPPSPGVTVGSCAWANKNFEQLSLQNMARAVRYNSMTQGLPPNCGTFDVIHIDGNHEEHGVTNDLRLAWPVLNTGGFILLDDWYMHPIKLAIERWLEGFLGAEEVLAVQFVDNERGHCYVRKTGLTITDLESLEDAGLVRILQ